MDQTQSCAADAFDKKGSCKKQKEPVTRCFPETQEEYTDGPAGHRDSAQKK